MSNIFHNMRNNVLFSKSYLAILVFLSGVATLVIGCNHLAEDTYSSYMGIQMLETSFGLVPTSWDFTYWTMSIMPQVFQIVFSYMFMCDTKKFRWAFWVAFGALVVDFFADVWYRGDARVFSDWKVFIISFLLTFVYFTIGSELAVSIGFGLSLAMLKPFIEQSKLLVGEVFDTIFTSKDVKQPQARVVSGNGHGLVRPKTTQQRKPQRSRGKQNIPRKQVSDADVKATNDFLESMLNNAKR